MKEKLNLLIDFSYIRKRPSCALSLHLYAGRLIQGFRLSDVFHPIALVIKGTESYIDSLAGFEVEKIVINGNEKVTFSIKLDRLLGLVSFEKRLQERNICAILTSEFCQYSYIFPKKYHQHFVIHDLIRVQRLGNKSDRLFTLMLKWTIKRKPHIISISQYTRKKLMNWSGYDSSVIYNSIPFDFHITETPVAEVQGKHYILDVNRFEAHKNASSLIWAMNKLRDRIPHTLYLKGVLSNICNIDELRSLVSRLGLEDRVIIDTSYRSEGEMRYLYTHADLFVTPSLEEGFGYTPIEAAVLKTPVLVSDIPVLREVTQGKIESFNPHSPEELAEKMSRIISNPPSDEERTALSEFYLKEYSLEKQIERFTEVILHNIGVS